MIDLGAFLDSFQSFLVGLNVVDWVTLCWFYVLIDVPRYYLTDLIVLVGEAFKKKADPVFVAKLRQNPPLVSVLIAGLNESKTVGYTIKSMQEQSYTNLEIIVVDDGSTDNMKETCQPYVDRGEITFFRFDRRNGKAAGLNLAAQMARGEFIVCVDADTTFDRDAVHKMLEPFADPKVGAVGGNLLVRNANQTLLTGIVAIEYMFSIGVGRRFRSMFNILNVISGAFGAFRREAVEEVGGHTSTSGNDGDLTMKIRKKFDKIVFVPEAICLTNSPEKLKSLAKQRRRWDRNLVKNRLRRHRDVFNVFSAGFRMSNLVLAADAILINVVLVYSWLFYFVYLLAYFRDYLVFALMINYILYFTSTLFQFSVAWSLSSRKRATWWLIFYIPLFPPYKYLFRFIRMIAYTEELLSYASYRDVFAPPHVSKQTYKFDKSSELTLKRAIKRLLGRR